jgi:hypothetical protein
MKKSTKLEQQITELKSRLNAAKKHERIADERQFITLAKKLGIFGLPAEFLAQEFQRTTTSHSNEYPTSSSLSQGDQE